MSGDGPSQPAWALWLIVAGVAGDLLCGIAYTITKASWLLPPAIAFFVAWLGGTTVVSIVARRDLVRQQVGEPLWWRR